MSDTKKSQLQELISKLSVADAFESRSLARSIRCLVKELKPRELMGTAIGDEVAKGRRDVVFFRPETAAGAPLEPNNYWADFRDANPEGVNDVIEAVRKSVAEAVTQAKEVVARAADAAVDIARKGN